MCFVTFSGVHLKFCLGCIEKNAFEGARLCEVQMQGSCDILGRMVVAQARTLMARNSKRRTDRYLVKTYNDLTLN